MINAPLKARITELAPRSFIRSFMKRMFAKFLKRFYMIIVEVYTLVNSFMVLGIDR